MSLTDEPTPSRRTGIHLRRADGDVEELEPRPGIGCCAHVFDWKSILAVDAAVAACRPLLVRGKPGTGKTQLAEAAAKAMGRAFLSFTVDGRTEIRDLKWTSDAVRRLADAQVLAARGTTSSDQVRAELDPKKYLRPGPLWWAFDGADARKIDPQGTSCPGRDLGGSEGIVLLIDEIDKADPSVPNGLLDAMGQGRFDVPDHGPVVRKGKEDALLVIFTTNEERALPDAFLRRCLVLYQALPQDRNELIAYLKIRGKANFHGIDEEVLQLAAGQLADDRQSLPEHLSPPGLAEYLDLLRVITRLYADPKEQRERLEELRQFTFRKYPPEDLK